MVLFIVLVIYMCHFNFMSVMSHGMSDKEYCPTSNIESLESSTEREAVSKRKRTSKVWIDFILVTYKGEDFAKCKHCGERLKASSGHGTSHLSRHIKSCLSRQINEGKQRTLALAVNDSGAASVSIQKFDMESIRKLMSKCVIAHELPFNLAEYKYHNKLLQACNHRFVPFSRRTMKREILSMYKIEKVRLEGFINDSTQRVSLTFDMWTSQQTLGYLCVTGQYVDRYWKLHAHMFSFVHVPPPHNANSLCEALLDCISKWNIQSKLFSITADNCSTNDSAITTLTRNLGRRHLIPMQGQHLHIRCGAHILNLMVQDGMQDLHDTISKVRESVKYVKGSPKRLHSFKVCIRTVGLIGTKKLTYDVPTRWNSTYIMLRDALFYKDAFQHLVFVDPNYINLPSEDEWSYATTLCQFLKLFYNVTNIFSATRNVTANVVFEEIQKVRNHLHTHSVAGNDYIKSLAIKMQGKFDKYWKNDYNVLFAIAFVLNPRSKLGYLKYVLEKLNERDAMVQYKKVERSLHELYAEYKIVYATYDEENENANNTNVEFEEERPSIFSRDAFFTYYMSSVSP
ncbi:zinc finger BED domain-containing protein RICESLEEPER 2-like isoform X2 [Nymphaea colorata]|uniref:zinc finger BED domain-containing protein RICESLEEPER 2-like isoform X2 n=1 Tax=Nymphaea colorata TaxID=210225 RepID=UPI00214EB80D|nr:zinc finger BED domain-containing protein RICESLEEPER 2-like isoform X2 [Nymphaea colorata]